MILMTLFHNNIFCILLQQVACSHLHDELTGSRLIDGLYHAVNVYFNSTGGTKCLNTSQEATGSLGDAGWDYQVVLT